MAVLYLTFKRVNLRTARSFEALVRLILSLLLLALLGAMGRAVYAVGARIFSTGATLHDLLKANLLDALTVLALLEVYKTTQAYFTLGRVKVTFILDTVLVVLLTEMMAFWFRDLSLEKVLLSLPLIVTLFAARVLAIRYSPDAVPSPTPLARVDKQPWSAEIEASAPAPSAAADAAGALAPQRARSTPRHEHPGPQRRFVVAQVPVDPDRPGASGAR